jgi:CheY-like chemotaxis protein
MTTPDAHTPPAPGADTSGLRMLVADDNRDAASTLAMLLQLHGHTVQLAFDGEQALAIFEREAPQICLLDIGMPQRDGYSVARAIRRSAGAQPLLVAVTGWGQTHDRQRALDAGFDHHLSKPVLIERLLELMATAPVR